MRIRRFYVDRFRSLLQVNLDDISDFSVFIGANSSGKSNLFEALISFFNELDPNIERSIGGIDDHLWYNRDDTQPIVFNVELEFKKAELRSLDLDEETYHVSDKNNVTIHRTIDGPYNSSKWTTHSIKLNDVVLIEDGVFTEPTDKMGNIVALLIEKVKGQLTYINAARDIATQQPFGTRASIIDSSILAQLLQLGQSREARQSRQWVQFETGITQCDPRIEDARIVANDIIIRERHTSIPIPVSLLGGGNQEVMYLIHRIQQAEGQLLTVEEPEAHLHPRLARQLMEYLRRVARGRQILITTHSTVFVDQANLDSVWIVRAGTEGTTVIKLESPDQLRSVLYELGHRPSDIFFADAIMFVEGPTEERVLPIWALKMGIDLSQHGVRIRPTYGKDSGKYHFEVLIQATENVGIPFFMMLDKDAEKQARALIRKGYLTRNETLFLLQKGDIEEYYPQNIFIDVLKDTLKSEYNLEATEDDIKVISQGPRCEKIEGLLKTKLKLKKAPRSWKPIVGEKVAQLMDIENLDPEIRAIIERISSKLRL